MQDEPRPSEILGAVAAFMRVAARETGAHIAFQMRVAGNALEIAQRHLDLAAAAEAEELARLKTILKRDGTLAELNAALALAIRAGEVELSTPGLSDHLWATTLAKLAVDQPNYSGYRAALAERVEPK